MGIIALANPSLVSTIVNNIPGYNQIPSIIDLPTLLKGAAIYLIVLGGAIALVGFLGCCGAVCDQKCFLWLVSFAISDWLVVISDWLVVISDCLVVISDLLVVISDWLVVISDWLVVISDWLVVISDWLVVISDWLVVISDWLVVISDWLVVISGGKGRDGRTGWGQAGE